MDVFGCGTDEPSRPLLPPGLCAICDQSPTQEAERVIDTRRNTFKGVSGASERKYICEGCATEMGAAMGMVPAEEHAAVAEKAEQQVFDLAAMHERLQVAESGQPKVVDPQAFLDQLKAELDALKPKPAARKPAASA